jgi:adenylyltransferase/sulfurtransferase
MTRPLTDAERTRYSRQIRVPGFGEAAQARLLGARALIVGVGGLGSPAAMYLAACGVGTLVLSDFDRVEASNLQRQIIHREGSIGEPKARSAMQTLRELNPACTVHPLDHALDDDELRAEIRRADVVLDCSDNFETRFQINRLCVESQRPLVSGSAIRADGQILSVLPAEPDSPCLRCLHGDDLSAVETCAAEGILAPVVGVIGVLQAQQALLVLAQQHRALIGTLLLFDGRGMQWRRLAVPRDPACPVCGARDRT